MDTLTVTSKITGMVGTLYLDIDAGCCEGTVELDGRTVKAHELLIHLKAGEPALVLADGVYL